MLSKKDFKELNFTVTDEEMNSLFVQFKELADNKKTMTDEDINSDTSREYSVDYLANTPEVRRLCRRGQRVHEARWRHSSLLGRQRWDFDLGRSRSGSARRADLMPLWTVLDCTPEGRRVRLVSRPRVSALTFGNSRELSCGSGR